MSVWRTRIAIAGLCPYLGRTRVRRYRLPVWLATAFATCLSQPLRARKEAYELELLATLTSVSEDRFV